MDYAQLTCREILRDVQSRFQGNQQKRYHQPVYIFDGDFLAFASFSNLRQSLAIFTLRAKGNFRSRHLYSRAVYRSKGVHADQGSELRDFYARGNYPERIGRR